MRKVSITKTLGYQWWRNKHLDYSTSQNFPIYLQINKDMSSLLHKTLHHLLSLANGSPYYLNIESLVQMLLLPLSLFPLESTFQVFNHSKCPYSNIITYILSEEILLRSDRRQESEHSKAWSNIILTITAIHWNLQSTFTTVPVLLFIKK